MNVLSKALEHPIVIVFFFILGFWNIFFPSDDWNLYLGIFIVVMTALNLRKYLKNRSIKSVRAMCEYCGYVALDERELHNHQITCEKKNSDTKNS